MGQCCRYDIGDRISYEGKSGEVQDVGYDTLGGAHAVIIKLSSSDEEVECSCKDPRLKNLGKIKQS